VPGSSFFVTDRLSAGASGSSSMRARGQPVQLYIGLRKPCEPRERLMASLPDDAPEKTPGRTVPATPPAEAARESGWPAPPSTARCPAMELSAVHLGLELGLYRELDDASTNLTEGKSTPPAWWHPRVSSPSRRHSLGYGREWLEHQSSRDRQLRRALLTRPADRGLKKRLPPGHARCCCCWTRTVLNTQDVAITDCPRIAPALPCSAAFRFELAVACLRCDGGRDPRRHPVTEPAGSSKTSRRHG